MIKKLVVLLLPVLFLSAIASPSKADELVDVQNQINKNQSDLSATQKSLEKVQKDLASLSTSLSGAQAQLEQANVELSQVKTRLEGAEVDLAKRRESLDYLLDVRNEQIRSLYQNPARSPLELFLSTSDLTGFTEVMAYQSQVVGSAQELIKIVNIQVADMEKTRNSLADSKSQLDALTAQVSARLASLKQSINTASSQKSYLNNKAITLQSSLKGLSDKQNQLIAAKIGNSIATGNLALADDPNAQVGYNPGFSPAFAAFSFGAYTHRNGMSQYGAKARANAGQSAEQILAAYYPGTSLNKNYPVPGTIVVNGTNEYGQNFNNVTYSFQEYLKHLYEVPSSWPMEVLKAQAVAARSYAIRYGSPICPSQSCQVVKHEINASAWQQAVDATNGWVLTGGSGSFQYSSTSGGYLNTSGWDTTCGNMSCWPGQAWESLAPSPWFYKGWYKTLGGSTCGRSHPWLNESEFVDILNSWRVYTQGNSGDKARVVTLDTACWGGNPYSMSEMKARADALGGSYNHVYGVTSGYNSGNGSTSSANFVTDKGTLSIDGQTFKDIFNLRAPGYVVIKTPLFNIERK